MLDEQQLDQPKQEHHLPDPKELAKKFQEAMILNLTENIQNADEIDEQDFQKSLKVKPYPIPPEPEEGEEKDGLRHPTVKPSPFGQKSLDGPVSWIVTVMANDTLTVGRPKVMKKIRVTASSKEEASEKARVHYQRLKFSNISTIDAQIKSLDLILSTIQKLAQSHSNLVPLNVLGRELGTFPSQLHAEVMQLWRTGKITVAAFEGRQGASAEEQKWWMTDPGDGGNIGYVIVK